MSRRVLLAYDDTPPAHKAFDYILKLPQAQRAELAILAVIRPSAFALDYGAQAALDGVVGELHGRLAQLQRRAQFCGSPSTTLIRLGHPPEQIVRAALDWHADLIVTGYRTRNALMSWLRGSVSSQVRAQAPCPVMIVR